jgi:hypothetical protein
MSTDLERRRTLTFRQRRDMGLTLVNLVRVTRQLAAEGVVDKDTPPEELRDAILSRLAAESPEACADPTVDWDAVLQFLEKLLPFLLQILALFGI